MAEGSSPVLARDGSVNDSLSSSLTKRHSRNLSPAGDSPGTTGSTSSSPKISRAKSNLSKDSSIGGLGDEEDSLRTPFSESELKKKMKSEKKGFFSGMSLLNIFSSPHHHKNSELHKIFTSLPTSEKLVDDYSCALQRDILIHGRLYVTQSWLCFYANIFSWETLLTIPFRSVQAITKEKTALIIPNAIQVATISEKYGFASLVNRDVTYNVIFKCWQNSLLEQPLSPLELVKAARKAHGESTDVGSEQDLWGADEEDVDGKTDSTSDVLVTMPTHVEIGRIPPTPSSINGDFTSDTLPRANRKSSKKDDAVSSRMEPIYGSVPGDLDKKGLDGMSLLDAGEDTGGAGVVTASESSEATPLIPVAKSLPVGMGGGGSPTADHRHSLDYGEKLSLGGESINSAEFETISLMEETGEVPCNCPEHIGRTILNDVYDTDVETIFRVLFTDSDFIRNFNKAEKTINVEMGEWQVQSDSSRLRDLSYTVALNYSFGPKFTHTTEHQIYSKGGQPGLKHIVDTEVVNHNIPYGDTFYTVCRYCLTRVAHNKTRLRVTANIKFKKTCWGLVKNLIERNAGDGLRTHYTHLDTILKEHVASLPHKRRRAHRKAQQSSSGTVRSRHKRGSQSANKVTSSSSSSAVMPTTPVVPAPVEVEQNGVIDHATVISSGSPSLSRSSSLANIEDRLASTRRHLALPRMNYALTVLLAVLVLTNMLLYYHLMGYNTATPTNQETAPSGLRQDFTQSDRINALLKNLWVEDWEDKWPLPEGEWPDSEEEWHQLLNHQLSLRWKQTTRYRDKITAMLKRLEKIELSLTATKTELLQHVSDMEETSRAIDNQVLALKKQKERN